MRIAVTSICWMLLGAACVNLEAPPDLTRHFLLSGPPAAEADGGFSVDVASVKLEPYLASHRMVVRSGENEIIFSDLNRWAEPLDDNIQRVLNGYLAVSPIGTISNRPVESARLIVHVIVSRFEGHLPDRATFAAEWIVENAAGETLVRRRSEHTVSGWGGTDYEQLTALLEETVAMLADEIAASL